MKKKNKNRKKSRTTLEDLTRQMGTSKKQSSLSDLLPRNHSYSSVLDNYELTINRTRGSVNDTVDEADEQPPYEVAVVYGKTEAILPNLRHFQEYSIEVRSFLEKTKNVYVFFCFYIAQYPLKALYTLQTCSFRHQLGFSGRHSSHTAIRFEDYSLAFPPPSIAMYSFIELCGLMRHREKIR